MTSPPTDGRVAAVVRFLELVATTPDAWRSFVIRCVALRIGGDLHNIVTRVTLDPREAPPNGEIEELASTRSVVAIRTVRPAKMLPDYLGRLRSGYMEFGDYRISCLSDVGGASTQPYAGTFVRVADAPSAYGGVAGSRGHTVTFTGDPADRFMREPQHSRRVARHRVAAPGRTVGRVRRPRAECDRHRPARGTRCGALWLRFRLRSLHALMPRQPNLVRDGCRPSFSPRTDCWRHIVQSGLSRTAPQAQ